jgi:hypothetical protein
MELTADSDYLYRIDPKEKVHFYLIKEEEPASETFGF